GAVAPDRAGADGEHAVPEADAAAHVGDVALDGGADQRDVPRPGQGGVGDAAAVPGGAVAGDGAILDHQVGVAHADAAPAAVVGEAVADGQAPEGDTDRTGSGAAHVEHPVDELAVNGRGVCPGPLEQGAARDVEVAGGVGVVGPAQGQAVDAGGQQDGV